MKNLPKIQLRERKEAPIKAGHPWVFSNAVEKKDKAEKGAVVEIISASGESLGIGTWNPDNTICVRVLSHNAEDNIDTAFFVEKLSSLDRAKKRYMGPGTTGYRIVHGDADLMPGLIADRFAETIVFQVHTIGMEKLKASVIEALIKVYDPKVVIERSDVDARKKEGLDLLPIKIHHGECSGPVEFQENGVRLLADVLEGQKTGFFLDQRDARMRTRMFSPGKKVLDLFGYTGGFSLNAAMGGADSVTLVDASGRAAKIAKEIFKLNGLEFDGEKYTYEVSDVFDFFNKARDKKYGFDLIICDPPAFAKSQKHLEQAIKTYTSLNKQCFELLGPGGMLISSSCSGMVAPEDFRSMLKIAAGRAMSDVRVVDFLGQPVDHTQKLSFPEGRYLKTAVLEKI